MSYLKEATERKKGVKDVIKNAALDVLGVDLDELDIEKIAGSLSLADILAVDDAAVNKNAELLWSILGIDKSVTDMKMKDFTKPMDAEEVTEYSYPGRAGVKSAATTRQAETPAAKAAANTATNSTDNTVPGGDIVATAKRDTEGESEENDDIEESQALKDLKRLLP